MINISLVTVQGRTAETAIRKAIGATQRAILYQPLIEACLISGFGSVAGLGRAGRLAEHLARVSERIEPAAAVEVERIVLADRGRSRCG
jgi:putative ABC transport system permease protein